MKAEKGSEIITTICEYENSVAMPDNERLTYLDTCGIARLKDGNGNVKAQEAYANRCSEYLRFGHEVDLAACGAYSPYDALKVYLMCFWIVLSNFLCSLCLLSTGACHAPVIR